LKDQERQQAILEEQNRVKLEKLQRDAEIRAQAAIPKAIAAP
jgi:hypothetical protein